MTAYVVNLIVILILVVGAFFRPGVGIGVALALGRHTFPDRTNPLIAAAPLLCISAGLGYRLSGRRIQISPSSAIAIILTTVVVGVGGFRHAGAVHTTAKMLADDKAFFLMCAAVPLLLLANTLRDKDIRVDFLRSLLGVTLVLTLLMIATGGGDREGALGGGPITLATSIGISILILVHYHDGLLPTELSPFETPLRIGFGIVYAYGLLVTQSRQPVLSLVLVLGIGSIAGLSRDRSHAADPHQLRRIRRLRAVSVIAIGIAVIGLAQLILGDSNSRFTLLADPSKEIARSRSFVWDAGLQMTRTAGVLGHGFGATVTADAPEIVFYPHNLFLELYAEVGPIVTLVVTACLALAAIHAALEGSRVFSLLALYAFLGAQFSGDLYNSRYLFVFLVAAAVVPPGSRLASRVNPISKLDTPDSLHLSQIGQRP